MASNSENIAQFMAVTGASDSIAQQYLSQNPELETAVSTYFAAQTGEDLNDQDSPIEEEPEAPTPAPQSGRNQPIHTAGGISGYTLSGEPVEAAPAAWGGSAGSGSGARIGRVGGSGSSTPRRGNASNSRFATLGSLGAADADSDDDEDKRQAELFAGGQNGSGMAIEGPPGGRKMPGQDVVNEILQKARDAGSAAREAITGSSQPAPSFFSGGGNTLGSDEAPSVAVPDPTARSASPRARGSTRRNAGILAALGFGGGAADDTDEEEEDDEPQVRHLTFWKDGFSIGDGPLMRYGEDDNDAILAAIKSGRAPLSLLNVKQGQPVELRVEKKTDEEYRAPPPKPIQVFEGSGNRLGAPAPEVVRGSTTTAITSTPGAFGTATNATAVSSQPRFEVDASKPITTVQVRLADGSKLSIKVNLTHTVGDLRGYVAASQTDRREFVLQTTFPNKVLQDDSQTIEAAGLKNAVVVQRWA